MKEDKKVLNAFALVGFVLGLLSVALYWVLGIVPLLAIIFSIIGLVGVKKSGQKGKGFAITGLVLGIVFLLAFGLQIFLRYNNYFQDNKIISVHEENSQSKFVGVWKHTLGDENMKTNLTLSINDYTYTYTVSCYINGEINYSNQRKGTVEFKGNKALLYQTQYIDILNSPREQFDLFSNPTEIEYKDGNIIFNSMSFEK